MVGKRFEPESLRNRVRDVIRSRLGDRRGTSMIEVLVAIIVVMFMLGLFTRVVSTSVRMLNASNEILEQTEKFNNQYYLKASYEDRETRGKIFTGLALQVSSKTDERNLADKTQVLKLSEDSAILVNPDDWGTGYYMFSVRVGAQKAPVGGEDTLPGGEEESSSSVQNGGEIIPGELPESVPEKPEGADYYWPFGSDDPVFSEDKQYGYNVQPSGFFQWTDGRWYIVIAPAWISPENYHEPLNNYGVVQWSGKAYTYDEFIENNYGENAVLYGDLCYYEGHWYIFKTNGVIIDNGPVAGNINWYQIPESFS